MDCELDLSLPDGAIGFYLDDDHWSWSERGALIRDPEVTANGFRVAAYLLSLADGWEASQRRICVATGLTRDAVGGGMKNLIETGWLVRNEYRNENDYLFKYEYVMNRSHRMGGNPVHMDDETDQWGSEDAWS